MMVNSSVLPLVRSEIMAMGAYRSARSEQTQGQIWLDANENPWGQPYNRYPEPQPTPLRQFFATQYGVPEDRVLITRGSDEGIDLLVRLFCRAGLDQVLICPPTYGMYRVAATIQGSQVLEIPLIKQQGFALDLAGMIQCKNSAVKIIFLCSPNNPTGNLLDQNDLIMLCEYFQGKAIIVIDEAYIEFSNSSGMIFFLGQYPHLIILRTLSKAFGLAGVRCGVTLAAPEIIALLKKIIAPYPIPSPVQSIILEQFTTKGRLEQAERLEIIRAEKEKLAQFLSKLPEVKTVWASEANFILFEVRDAASFMSRCQHQGIILRNRSADDQLKNCIRVTVGSPAENKLLMEVL